MTKASVQDGGITRQQLQECIAAASPTIVEIGCNDGTHTQWFLELFQNPRIYCFEPDPRAARRFRERIGAAPQVTLFEMAVSRQVGEVTFYQSGGERQRPAGEELIEGWDLSGSIRKPKEHLQVHPWVTFDRVLTVPTTTLELWRQQQQIELIDFLWMDVQGAEMDVFQGGASTLARTRFLYTEYNQREMYEGQCTLPQLRQHLQGFELLVRFRSDALFVNRQLVPRAKPPRDRTAAWTPRNILRWIRKSPGKLARRIKGLLPKR